MGLLRSVKDAQISRSSLVADYRHPAATGARDAFIARRISGKSAPVADILRLRGFSQIDDPIIKRIAVDMVDLVAGPRTMIVKPNNAVKQIFFPLMTKKAVAVHSHISDGSLQRAS